MTDYRRAWRPGATWFFTVNLADRSSSLLVDRIGDLREAFRYVLARHPYRIDALCVLPDHLHAVFTLPPVDADIAVRWQLIKTHFSRRIPATEARSSSRGRKGERGIWQRRYWEHVVRDEDDLRAHLDYTHFNPVKHGHVDRAVDWPHSTFHREVLAGRLPADWGGSSDVVAQVGERAPQMG
jgi:putative transposase